MGTISLTIDNEIELIDEYVSSGSDIAANKFVRKYQKFVYSVAFRYLKSEADADDVTQETFIKAFGSMHKFKKQSSVNTWLYRIVSNTSKNVLRKRKVMSIFSYSNEKEDFYDIASNTIAPDRQFENKQLQAQFLKALESLPEKQRETFALRYYEELPYEEISKMLGTSVGGLKANYYQAVKKLAKLLENQRYE